MDGRPEPTGALRRIRRRYHRTGRVKGGNLPNELFRLTGDPAVLNEGDAWPRMSPGDVVSDIVLGRGVWPAAERHVRQVTFRNVAFSKRMSRLTFTECTFEKCLFIGTRFREIEFHHCDFFDCNFWKARFTKVYLDPNRIILGKKFREMAANAGISVFQALVANFADEQQADFHMSADIQFRRWKRYQIWNDLRRQQSRRPNAKGKWLKWLSNMAYATGKWLKSVVYELIAGFGYRPGRLFITTVALFFAVACVNHFFIGDRLTVNGMAVSHMSFVDSIFYTFSILTVLGFSSIVPADSFAKLLTVFEALAAIGWLGILTSVFVKRFVR